MSKLAKHRESRPLQAKGIQETLGPPCPFNRLTHDSPPCKCVCICVSEICRSDFYHVQIYYDLRYFCIGYRTSSDMFGYKSLQSQCIDSIYIYIAYFRSVRFRENLFLPPKNDRNKEESSGKCFHVVSYSQLLKKEGVTFSISIQKNGFQFHQVGVIYGKNKSRRLGVSSWITMISIFFEVG